MTVPGQSIPEEDSEDADGTDTDSMRGINELSPAILSLILVYCHLPYCQLILVYCHHRLLELHLMGKLERRGLEEHFIKVTKVKE